MPRPRERIVLDCKVTQREELDLARVNTAGWDHAGEPRRFPFSKPPRRGFRRALVRQSGTARNHDWLREGPMIQLALITLLVFMSPGSAVAQCAWVLWERAENTAPPSAVLNTVEPPTWQTITSTETAAACWEAEETQRSRRANSYLIGRGKLVDLVYSRPGGFYITYWREERVSVLGALLYHYVCLPDTIDPRGANVSR
jgi:hypothetical protein